MSRYLRVVIWNVEHGACAMMQTFTLGLGGAWIPGRLAMVDSGDRAGWSPTRYIRDVLGRSHIDYLFITNADQDHMSDLRGLSDAGITVGALYRNPTYSREAYRRIKMEDGPMTSDAEWYADALDTFVHPLTEPFDQYMGGATVKAFYNSYPLFTDTNNLSLVALFKFGDFGILFPGDLEKPGWRHMLLTQPDFAAELANVNIMVASHHGRENGFCPEVFNYCFPQAVVISDKPIEHETQLMTPDYRTVVLKSGVIVRTTSKQRHVLTTRRDGWISIDFHQDRFFIDTEKLG